MASNLIALNKREELAPIEGACACAFGLVNGPRDSKVESRTELARREVLNMFQVDGRGFG